VEHRQQKVALRHAAVVPTTSDVVVAAVRSPPEDGAEHRRSPRPRRAVGVWGSADRVPFSRRHERPTVGVRSLESLSIRTAAALNSAVPDFGSVASIVSTLVSTCSGKWKVMNTSPGRSSRVDAHRRLDRLPRGDD
jgi:hypothetical protein